MEEIEFKTHLMTVLNVLAMCMFLESYHDKYESIQGTLFEEKLTHGRLRKNKPTCQFIV